MVSILPAERSPWDVISKSLGQNLSQTLPGAAQQYGQREALQRSLSQIQQLSQDPNASSLDIMLATMKAGAGIPGSEKYLGTLMPELVKFANARRGQGVTIPGEEEQFNPQRQSQPLPEFMQQPGQENGKQQQFFPTNLKPQGGPGNVPQEATTGVKLPYLSRKEKIQKAKRVSKDYTDNGIPTSIPEAMKMVEEEEADKRLRNSEVDTELEQRVSGQEKYGNKAVQELHTVLPDATPEMEKIFQKYGEDASKTGKSEADINRYLTVKARDFSDNIDNIKKDLSAPRLQNKLMRASQGTYKDFEQSAADLRVKLQPLLDLGLYDTARKLLKDLDYAPEEREMIINPMSERQKTLMNQVPKIEYKRTPYVNQELRPEFKSNVKEGLMKLKETDPNFSLVLARKAFEDKNYDWRLYKDALNEMVKDGSFELSGDQGKQLRILDTPPLNALEQILESIGVVGR